jgi:hypothetical protein
MNSVGEARITSAATDDLEAWLADAYLLSGRAVSPTTSVCSPKSTTWTTAA